ncbi:FAD-dependent monooxygenase [Cyanobacteria bacterium FACHB-471]|nr:FAD-dependent monooxygenase [Cyanobacteria bacterium FACHB-471]
MSIAIIGGGIGGLTTANALLRKGFNVQVYEKAQSLRSIGAGLSLTPNGLNSLNAIQPGIVEVLKHAGSLLHTLTLKRSTGETIASNPMTLMQQYGQPILNIQWSKLQAILALRLPSDIIHFNHRCVGFEQENDQITVYFAHQKSIQPDLLIGADGINSVVRQTLVGDGFPNFADRVSWRAVLQYHHELLPLNTSTLITTPDGKSFLLVDVGGGYIFWSAIAPSADDFVHQRATHPKTRVLERFAEWVEPVGAIIEATPVEEIVEQPICDRPPLKHWSKGRATLVGDAAHLVMPFLQQGANMAFEDAYELAEYLSAAPDIETALNVYEKSRIPRTTAIYDRTTAPDYHPYQADGKIMFNDMTEPSQMSQDEFETWLYGYTPSITH